MHYCYCHMTNKEFVICVVIALMLIATPKILELFFDHIWNCKKYNKKSLSRLLDEEKE